MGGDVWSRLALSESNAFGGKKRVQVYSGKLIQSEDDLCRAMVAWFDRALPGKKFDLIHIANEGSGSVKRGALLKQMGVRAGVPDYLVSKDGIPVGWVEVKFGYNKLTDEQRKFRDMAKAGGFKFAEIRSLQAFKDILCEWGVYSEPKFNLDINKIFKVTK